MWKYREIKHCVMASAQLRQEKTRRLVEHTSAWIHPERQVLRGSVCIAASGGEMGTGSCTAGAAKRGNVSRHRHRDRHRERDLKQKSERQCSVKQLAPSDSLVTAKDVEKQALT